MTTFIKILPKLAFVISCLFFAYIIGILTVRFHLFPYPQLSKATKEVMIGLEYIQRKLPWQHFRYTEELPNKAIIHDSSKIMPGLTLISSFTDNEQFHSVSVIQPDGTPVHSWRFRWKDFWPEKPNHISKQIMSRGQKHLHGIALAENGDVIFNFTELAMFRVNPCGKLVWRLDKRTHHSIDLAMDGSIWVPGVITHTQPVDRFPNHTPPFEEFTVLHVSAQGKVLQELSINALIQDWGLSGLLYLSTLNELTPKVSNDTLHLNDVEVFPENFAEGIFKQGDIMVSLRNINTIVVFNPITLDLRYISTGQVMRQHDPDFVNGNTISIFDNNNLLNKPFDNLSGKRGQQNQKSFITTLSALENRAVSRFEGGDGGPFFSDLMGAHQNLKNGNLLITEARAGRLFEVSPSGQLVWEYFAKIGPNLLGDVSYAERLKEHFDVEFFEAARKSCE